MAVVIGSPRDRLWRLVQWSRLFSPQNQETRRYFLEIMYIHQVACMVRADVRERATSEPWRNVSAPCRFRLSSPEHDDFW